MSCISFNSLSDNGRIRFGSTTKDILRELLISMFLINTFWISVGGPIQRLITFSPSKFSKPRDVIVPGETQRIEVFYTPIKFALSLNP